MDKSSETTLREGDTFSNLAEFTKKLGEYQNASRQYYVKSSSRTLASFPVEGANLTCVYQYAKYSCKFGPNRHRKEERVFHEGSRETKTIKCECGSFIYVVLHKSKCKLEIKKINLAHTGHEGSEEFYDLLPEMRRLDQDTIKLVHQYWNLQVPRQIIMDEVLRLKKITMTAKDLDNIIIKFRDANEDSLKSAVDLLKKKYGCNVTVVVRKKTDTDGKVIKEFQCLYFSTDKMRKALASWSQIVFIDSTYKLLKKKLIVFVLAIQDSNRMTQIVGIGLVIDETKDTVKKLLQCFIKDHGDEVCSKIKVFMSDKDLTERGLIKELFPWVELLLCEFHVLRIFSRTVSTSGMDIKKEVRLCALRYLDQMTKSRSEEEYMNLYNEFCTKVPDKVVQYFNKNWHGIRNQWTRYGMSQNNCGNYTNNCVESTNARLKNEIDAYSTLTAFVIGFFRFYERRNRIIRLYLKDQYYKNPLTGFQKGSPEYDYQKLLTAPACRLVIKQLQRRKPMSLYNIDETLQECWIQSGFVMLKSSTNSCDCTEFTSHDLPCRHIFAVRSRFGLPLFVPDLCAIRWTKQYDKQHQPTLNASLSLNITNNVEPMIVTTETINNLKKMTAKGRQKVIMDVAKDLANVGANASGVIFQNRVKLLESIVGAWLQNIEIDASKFRFEFLAKSSNNAECLLNEKLLFKSPAFKTPSRAKHLKKCTIQYSKK